MDDYLELFELIYERLLDASDEADGERIIRALVKERPISWEVFARKLTSLRLFQRSNP